MECRQIDVFDDAEFDRHYEIEVTAESFERPYYTPWALDSLKSIIRAGDPAEQREMWGLFDGTQMVAAAWLEASLLDNISLMWSTVYVEPQRRRQGLGGAMLDGVLRRAEEMQRTTVVGMASYPAESREDHPYRRFAEKHGFALANTEVHRVLDLPVDLMFLQSLVDEAAPHHASYRLRSFTGTLPDELLPSYCHLHNQLGLDAPTGDIDYEEEKITPEMWLERDAKMKAAGRTRCTTVALDAAGDVVAYTDLMIPDNEPGMVHQWGTLVSRDHRGHRLGLAVKAANLVKVQQEFPDRKVVHTGNSEVNQFMVGINERLGFRAVELFAEFQRKLA